MFLLPLAYYVVTYLMNHLKIQFSILKLVGIAGLLLHSYSVAIRI